MAWITNDKLVGDMVGEKVWIYTEYGEGLLATVLAVSDRSGTIRVRCEDDGEIMVGNQWEQV